jgi:hypothetical protein
METEGSLPRPKDPATGSYPEPDASNPFSVAYVVAKNSSNSEALCDVS